ncbi:hypothetical protein Pla163_07630 [Planctomycetes bacterium Pla163]|uniref:HEAT repeat protein n=1 Tax=Rohdeia mirabilis TaxID=2528008 RepID=A0A518CWR7_9BACT|nr:hypothetical protein Pla163_07630 [Planctomycetes bacterium Pla163]
MLRLAHASLALATIFPFVAGPALAEASSAVTAQDEEKDDEKKDDEEEEKDAEPTDEEVEAAVAKLKAALDEGSFDEKVQALEAARSVPHKDVVKIVATAVKDDAKEVRIAAVTALGYLDVDQALDTLHGWSKKKTMTKDDDFALALFKAIGRHGDKSSLKYLEDNIFSSPKKVLEARIVAMGKIRHEDAVEEVIGIMNKMRSNEGGPGGNGKEQKENVPHMDAVQLALHALTGANEGTSRRDWQTWWNENKRKLEIDPKEMPPMERSLENKWLEFWNERRKREGGERGGEGGGRG